MTQSVPSGKVYPISHTQRYYRASAPGQPPAIRTGVYRASWRAKSVEGVDEAEVGTGDVRGPWLEKGTENMAPRPHVRQGYEHNREGVNRAFAHRWDEGL
jgi:hypothetical protein